MSSDAPRAYEDATADDAPGVTGAAIALIVAPLLAVASGLSGLIVLAFDSVGEVLASVTALRDFIVVIVAEGPSMILTEGASVTAGELSEFGVGAFVVAAVVVAIAWLAWTAIDPEVPLLDDLLPWR